MMKSRILIVPTFTVLFLLTINCGKKDKYDLLYGNIPISDYYEGKKCLSCNYESYTFYFDKSGWVIIDKMEGASSKAQFKFHEKAKGLYAEFFNATDSIMNGVYEVKIDTIDSNEQTIEVSIKFQSEKVFFKGYKALGKK